MTHPIRYHEVQCAFEGDPLSASVALARAFGPQEVIIYEHPAAWCVAIGVATSVVVTAEGISTRDHAGHRTTRPLGAADTVLTSTQHCLRETPIVDWRAYGFASFELAHLIQDDHVALPSLDWPYLHLSIPRLEVRITARTVLFRALEPADLQHARELVACSSTCITDHCLVQADVRTHEAANYRDAVAKAIAAIRCGEFAKVILSRAIPVTNPIDFCASYVAGRRCNQPARSFLLQQGARTIVGFSPETIVEVGRDGRVSTQPLAGTRARSGDPHEDAERRRELCSDLKEVAEHALSVKLACEEMALVCRPESVQVEEFMNVAERGSVQHLASRVAGRLAPGRHAFHALGALFPAVTASGIPKSPALRFIRAHEPRIRGPYSGAVLFVDADGSLDAALVLRALYRHGTETWLQAGAGIVSQSTPERELEETCEKLLSVSRHLVAATRQTGPSYETRAVAEQHTKEIGRC